MANKETKFRITTAHIPSFLFALIAMIFIFAPYQNNGVLSPTWLHTVLLSTAYVFTALSLLFLIPNIKKKDISRKNFLMMIPMIVLLFLNIFHSYGSPEINGLVTILWILFCLFPKDMKIRTFKIFKTFWWITCVVGILCFFAYLFKIPLPYQEVPYYFGGDNMTYVNYGVSFLYKYNDTFRLCGICNEPGYLGTFCALILCASGMKLKKKENLIIFVAGILSFSLAFAMIVLVYWLLKLVVTSRKNSSKGKKVVYCGLAIAVISLFLFALPNIEFDDGSAFGRIMNRMVLTSEGLSGDNRTNKEFDKMYASLSPLDLLAGMGRGYVSANGITGVLSYKIYVMEFGLFGVIILWGSLLFAAIYKNRKNMDVWLFVIMFFASMYQRPNIFTLAYAIILFGGIEYILYADSDKIKELKREENKNEINQQNG